jgi:hypothetical protein
MGFLDRLKEKMHGSPFTGGAGDTPETAIIIRGMPNHTRGVQAEYLYLTRRFGRRGTDWELTKQALLQVGGRSYDEMRIKLSDGTQKTIFFDITEFFGKW